MWVPLMSSYTITALLLACVGLLAFLALRTLPGKGGYHAATVLWCRGLPLLSTVVFTLLILANLTPQRRAILGVVSLKGFFSFPELLLLLIVGGLYTTRIGQALAALCTSLILVRAGLRPSALPPSGIGLALLLTCSVMVMMLGDYMPWLPGRLRHQKSALFRSIMLACLCVASIGVSLIALSRLRSLSPWLLDVVHWHFSQTVASVLLYSVLIGWTLVALGAYRQFLLFALSLPTVLLLAFVSGSSAGLFLVAYLTLSLSLAVGSAERRMEQRIVEPNGAVTMVLYGNPL